MPLEVMQQQPRAVQQPQVFYSLPGQNAVFKTEYPSTRPVQVLQIIQVVDPTSVGGTNGLVAVPSLPLVPQESVAAISSPSGVPWQVSPMPQLVSPLSQLVSPFSQHVSQFPRQAASTLHCVPPAPQNLASQLQYSSAFLQHTSSQPRTVSLIPRNISSASPHSSSAFSNSESQSSITAALLRKRPLFSDCITPASSSVQQLSGSSQAASHLIPSLLSSSTSVITTSAMQQKSRSSKVRSLPPPLLKSPEVLDESENPSSFRRKSVVVSSRDEFRVGPPPLKKTKVENVERLENSILPPTRILDCSGSDAEMQDTSLLQRKDSRISSQSPKPICNSPPPLERSLQATETVIIPSGSQSSTTARDSLQIINSTFKNLLDDDKTDLCKRNKAATSRTTAPSIDLTTSSHSSASRIDATASETNSLSSHISKQSRLTRLASASEASTSSSSRTSSLQDLNHYKEVPPQSPPQRKKTRTKYTLEQKMEIVNYAKTYSIYRACKHYKLSTGTIGPWTKLDFTKLKSKVYRKKKSGRRISYPREKEAALIQWVLEQQDLHQELSIRSIMDKAMEIIGQSNPSFLASRGWAQKFMRRNDLVVQSSRKHLSDKLPAILEAKSSQFLDAVKDTLKNENLSFDLVINMDEIPMFFGGGVDHEDEAVTPSDRAAAELLGGLTVPTSTAAETKKKERVTVVLAATASGKILPAMVIFKGEKPPANVKAPDGWMVCAQSDGWMDNNLMELWCQKILFPYTNQKKSLLIMDSFAAHCGERVQDILTNKHISIAHIPGGCTTRLQPLSVWLGHPFNSSCHEEFSSFCRSQLSGGSEIDPNIIQIIQNIKEGVNHLASRPVLITTAFRAAGCTLDGEPINVTVLQNGRNYHTSQNVASGAALQLSPAFNHKELSESDEDSTYGRRESFQDSDQDIDCSYVEEDTDKDIDTVTLD